MTSLINRANTALVVVDVQNGVVANAHGRDEVVANINSLVARARVEDVPVIWVQHSDDDLVEHTPGWQIVDDLEPGDDDPIIHKHYGDAFEDTSLESELARLGVGRLIVTGAQTDACIRATLHGAFVRGYDTTLVADAHTTEDFSGYGLPPADKVIAHTNMYWTWQAGPGRTAEVVDAAHVEFHPGGADEPAPVPEMPAMDQAFWDDRYGSADRIWSGDPNPQLVADTADLAPGRALDVGAGEGADAIWLAERGWTVDALDISTVALERGRAEAAARGDVATRINWIHADALSDELPAGPYDLVSLQFMHFPKAERTALFLRCMAAVAPGGTLLIVAHHPSDLHTTAHRPRMPDRFYAADEVAELLDDAWTVLASDARPRQQADPQGNPIEVHDAVLVARREPSASTV